MKERLRNEDGVRKDWAVKKALWVGIVL